MHPLIETNRAAIIALCREFGIEKLEVFGSIMTDAFTDESDVDFIVYLPDGFDYGSWGSRYYAIETRLGAILNRDVDIVTPNVLSNRWFRLEADKTRTEIFNATKIPQVA